MEPANVIIAPEISPKREASIKPLVSKIPPRKVNECLTIPKNCSFVIDFIIVGFYNKY